MIRKIDWHGEIGRPMSGLLEESCLVCGLLFALAPGALSDGTLMSTAGSTRYNPCNGEYPKGTVENLIVVETNQRAQGPHVIVHRTFHGTLKDSSGNVYEISSASCGWDSM
jgi:hypothetical protein